MGFFDIFGGASNKAGGAQEQAASEALHLQRQMYDQQRADLEPWRKTGAAALGNLNALLIDGDTSRYQATPGYDFRFNEGQRALERSANAKGMLSSGATAKALMKYGQDIGSAEFDNYINRNALLAGYGQNATQQGVQAAGNFAQIGGQTTQDMGAARASSYTGASNQLTGLLRDGAQIGAYMYGRR